MISEILQKEIAHLIEVGFLIEAVEEGNKILIIFKDFKLPKGVFNVVKTDLLVWTTSSYPSSNFDMFWVDKDLLLVNNQTPKNAQHIELFCGKSWRRFSIHPYNAKPWNPLEDSLESYLVYIQQRLNTKE